MAPSYTSDWYIDGVWIDGINTTVYSDGVTAWPNLLHYAESPVSTTDPAGTPANEAYVTTGGRKWLVQITNNTGDQFDLSTTSLTLRICTKYGKVDDDDSTVDYDDFDIDMNYSTGLVDDKGSIFVGFTGDSSAPWGPVNPGGSGNGPDTIAINQQGGTTPTTWGSTPSSGTHRCPLIADQTREANNDTGVIYTARSRFILRVGTTTKDIVFANTDNGSANGSTVAAVGDQGIFRPIDEGATEIDATDTAVKVDITPSPDYTVPSGNANNSFVIRRRGDGLTGNGLHFATAAGSVPTTTFGRTQWAWVTGSDLQMYLDPSGGVPISALGDPHITTLAGEHYEFDYLGPFRLYEATAGDQKLTINALAKLGPGRWNEKQYLRELYIQHGDKWAHVDMGFRGSPLKILESEGLEHEEKSLEFDPEAKRYSFSSQYRTTDWTEPVTEDLPALVRNAIDFVIAHTRTGVPAASIHLENVNKYNLQPCRTVVHPVQDAHDAKGCLVARRYASVAALDDLRDTTPLREPTSDDLERMPELEIAPAKRNIQWQ